MRPLLVPLAEILDAFLTFTGFVVPAESGVYHLAFGIIPLEQAYNDIPRHSVSNLALSFPILFVPPLRDGCFAIQAPAVNLLQHPVSKTSAIKKPCTPIMPGGRS